MLRSKVAKKSKLVLNRASLRVLSGEQLGRVRGGDSDTKANGDTFEETLTATYDVCPTLDPGSCIITG